MLKKPKEKQKNPAIADGILIGICWAVVPRQPQCHVSLRLLRFLSMSKDDVTALQTNHSTTIFLTIWPPLASMCII